MSLSALIKKGGLRKAATATLATSATVEAATPPSVATVATVAVATAPKRAANDPAPVQDFAPEALAAQGMAPDPDRHCWPHTVAMNTAEIDTFTARVHLFTRNGLGCTEAEGLADGLVVRDRQADNRRVCLECSRLRRGGDLWRCGQWPRAGMGGAEVPGEVVALLQRCDGFKEAGR